ncbi:hypothetical protein EDD16DRAFT_1611231 [Pisolithus croceorrhizus]|nr:hypothetical protein EDD16DRAFT_1611231 [Pisolithus croceorrhizus]KAI6111911.1 hypothetical protein EV401DRAFT_1987821 [Pisolithus croceorrhizus]
MMVVSRRLVGAFSKSPQRDSKEYVDALLPSSSIPALHTHRRRPHTLTLRRLLFCLAMTPVFVLLILLCQGIPPTYDDVRSFERRLTQHSLTIPPSTVDKTQLVHHPRYLRFPGHLWGHGLNNVLQEALLMSYLAYVSNVSFVFEDYTWTRTPLPWSMYGFALRPARIPLNAIISGPTAGGPMPHGSQAPLAVSAEFYEKTCGGPEAKPYVISSAFAPNEEDGSTIIEWWTQRLTSVQERCIEIDSTPHDLFDRFLFGGPRILSLWDSLISSPILSEFTWSPIVQSAVARNFALLRPDTINDIYAASSSLHGLVAVHLRRGDYKRHCPNLAKWGAKYMGFNQHPSLLDRFDPSPYEDDSVQKEEYYLAHCLPTIEQLISVLRTVRREYRTQGAGSLKRVYVLSNERAWALGELKNALKDDGWEDVVSTVDLHLDAEQHHVSMAVDMAIAERAEVFIGNGFSSLSSNVVLLRMAKGMDVRSNRFL